MTTTCPTCGASALKPFLRRDRVPVYQNHPEPSAEAAVAVARGDLHLDVCRACGFVFNAAFDRDLVEYNELYESDQSCSPSFARYVSDLIDRLVASGVREKQILEIGCGTGSFLEQLCARGNNRGVGFDPVYSGPDVSADGRVRFFREFFTDETTIGAPDFVFCRHVVGHVARPFEFLRRIRYVIGDRPCTFFIETPALEWSLDNLVIQDFFYEYCSYFTQPSLELVVARAGFEVVRLERVFDEQYFWLQTTPVAATPVGEPAPAGRADLLRRIDGYVAAERARLDEWRSLLDRLRGGAPTCIWGAGAKGVTFLNMLDADRSRIAFVVDVNPRKQGKYVSGTGHRIESPSAVAEHGIGNVVVMNESYRREITDWIAGAGLPARVWPD